MSSEGLDIGDLNTVIFTTPKSSIEQSIGRIIRKAHAITPLAFDLVDNFSAFPSQYKKREAVYRKLEYDIFELKVSVSNYSPMSNPFNMLLDESYNQVVKTRKKKNEITDNSDDDEKTSSLSSRLSSECLINDD
jgi:predicted helicase